MPEPAAPPEPRMIDDPLLGALAADLAIVVQTEEATKINAAPEIKPVVEDEPAKAKPEKKEAIKATVRPRVNLAQELDSALSRHLGPAKAPELPAPKAEELDVTGLHPAQLDELEDARFLEARDPSKKGLSKKIHDFYREIDEWVAKHPDNTPDESDPEFKAQLDRKPKWQPGERDKVRKMRITDEVKAETMKELAPKLEAANRDAREAKVGPRIERAVIQFETDFDAEVKSDDPLEKEVYSQYRDSAKALADDWLRLNEGLDSITAPKDGEQAARHKWLASFVTHQSSTFAKDGGENRVRNGKAFVTPAKWREMAKGGQDLTKVWTLNSDDVLGMLKISMIQSAKAAIKNEEESANRRGFVRQKPAAAAKPAEEPKPTTGVRASSTPAPGVASDANPPEVNQLGQEIIDVLQLKT